MAAASGVASPMASSRPPPISVDALFGYADGGVVPGLAAFVIAIVGATGQLASRRLPEAVPAAG